MYSRSWASASFSSNVSVCVGVGVYVGCVRAYMYGSVCVCSHMFCIVRMLYTCVVSWHNICMYACILCTMHLPKYLYAYCIEKFGDIHPIHMCIPVPSPIAKDGQRVLSLKDQDSRQCLGECCSGSTWG